MKQKISDFQMPSWIKPARIVSRIIGVMMILFFSGIFGLGTYFTIKTNKFLETAVKTEGKVVEMEKSYSDGNSRYCPIFTFVDNTGNEQRARSSVSSYPPPYEVGDNIPVLYDPQNPEKADIDSFWNLWLASVVFFVLSAPALIFGAVLAFVLPFVFTRIGMHIETKKKEPEQITKP
ncbi:MAG: DUF3592 domain-containing protein [Planctomycetota bacterium]